MLKVNFCFNIVLFVILFSNADTNKDTSYKFEVIYEWQYLNFTWPTQAAYKLALKSRQYIPENNVLTGVKIYNGRIYLSLPKLLPGTPVALAHISTSARDVKTNPLLTPYPSWEMNLDPTCNGLQSVMSMEIDRYGRMWIIDGVRTKEKTKCPAKLVVLDIEKCGKVVQKYIFPNETALAPNGFVDDIVIDESGGGFAYMTDSSKIDPGLIVYSLKQNRSWKLRDTSMFPNLATSFVVNGTKLSNLLPVAIDGLALSPRNSDNKRKVFFCPLASLKIYSIDTKFLKNESYTTSGEFRSSIEFMGKKQAQSDGLIMDNKFNLFYSLFPIHAIGKWNIQKEFSTSRIIYRNDDLKIWPISFSFDGTGNLYVTSSNLSIYFKNLTEIAKHNSINIRILKARTGTNSYLY